MGSDGRETSSFDASSAGDALDLIIANEMSSGAQVMSSASDEYINARRLACMDNSSIWACKSHTHEYPAACEHEAIAPRETCRATSSQTWEVRMHVLRDYGLLTP